MLSNDQNNVIAIIIEKINVPQSPKGSYSTQTLTLFYIYK